MKLRGWANNQIMYYFNLKEYLDAVEEVQEEMCPSESDLMHFTGLQDRYGNEIYEGDLVESVDCIDEVIFQNGCFMVKPLKGKYHTVYLHELAKHVRVVGNKYQTEVSK